MGSYVNEHLIKDEQVVYETTYHWIIFLELASIFTLFIRPLILKSSDEFVVTNKRIIIKTGFISRDTIELNLNKVESIEVEQSVFGRMLGFGTLKVNGTGVTGQAFHKIDNPLEFRRRLQEQYDQYTQNRGTLN
ncbi:MAG: PH domain-containing protein [Cytophagaceae bacterium]|nr:PH domain-containing protein [Cytophagaceae bacterium]